MTTARLNSSYTLLRTVIAWAAVFVGVLIVFSAAAALKFSSMVRPAVSGALQLSSQSYQHDYSSLPSALKAAHDKLELNRLFNLDQIAPAYGAKQIEVKTQERELTAELNVARQTRDVAGIESAVTSINNGRIQLQGLANAKAQLSNHVAEENGIRRKELETKEGIIMTAFFAGILLIAVILLVLIVAAYQALICVIDISDCQVEIFVRGQRATNTSAGAGSVSPLKYGV